MMIPGFKVVRLHRRTLSRGAWGVVLAGMLVCGTCWLNAADEAPSAGLKGILPNTVPAELTAAIAELPETWKPWGDAFSKELSNLYEGGAGDVASQRQSIAALRARIATVNKNAADPRYRAILTQLVTISGGLKRRLDMAEAALDTLERGPEVRAANIDAARKRVQAQSQALDSYLGSIRNGSGWAKYLQVSEVRGAVAGGDADPSASALSTTQARLKERDHLADARARDFLNKPQFAAYERAVDEYLAALKAPAAAANSPELRKGLGELLGALEQFEDDHSTAASSAARRAFDAVRSASPDGGDRIMSALRLNYLNYNLRIVANEAFLNKFVSQTRDETGPVRDFVLGADVYGNQFTRTSVGINLVPSGNSAQFDIVANGAVNSSTEGFTDQATVFTQGNHFFVASKRIAFDGDRFWTQPARISVNANNMTTGADVNMMRVPILHGIADRIAVRRAEEQRGESEAIAASRVQEKVLPKFNSEIDAQFGPNGKSTAELSQKLGKLRELQLYPDARSWTTTDTELRGAARLMDANELGGSDPNPALYLGRGLTLLLHQTIINNAIDRLDFNGKTMTDDEIKAKIENEISTLLGKDFKLEDHPATATEPKPETEGEPVPRTLVFDKNDPIRADVADGSLVITIRAGFKQEGKEDIPTQIITIPLKFSVDMKNVVISRENISIAAAGEGGGARQLASAGVIRKKMSEAFPERREVNRVRYLQHEGRKIQAAVTRVRALDGWMSVSFE